MTAPAQDPNRVQRLQVSLQLHGMLGMGAGLSIAATSSIAGALTGSGYDTAGRIVMAAALLPCLVALWVVTRMMRIWNEVVAELDTPAPETTAGEQREDAAPGGPDVHGDEPGGAERP